MKCSLSRLFALVVPFSPHIEIKSETNFDNMKKIFSKCYFKFSFFVFYAKNE